MSTEKVQGLADAYRLFDRIPDDARDQLGVELAIISRDILAIQRAAVPVDTGELRGGLSIAVTIAELRARIGLIGTRKRFGSGASRAYQDLFYGRIVEFGRSGQTVNVTRKAANQKKRRKALLLAETASRVRLRKSDGKPVGSPYKLRVKGRKPHPFINVPGAEDVAIGQLADFWSRVLARSGAN